MARRSYGTPRRDRPARPSEEPGVLGLLVLTVVACLALTLITSVLAGGEPRHPPVGPAATHAPSGLGVP